MQNKLLLVSQVSNAVQEPISQTKAVEWDAWYGATHRTGTGE